MLIFISKKFLKGPKMFSLKNNKGNTIVIVIVSVVLLAAIAGGTYLYIRYQNNKKIIDQYNSYGKKRGELKDILSEIPSTLETESDLAKLKDVSKKATNKWNEVENSELPEFISKEMINCHDRQSKHIEAIEFTAVILDKFSRGLTPSTADEAKRNELADYIPTIKNLENTKKICEDADNNVEKELNKLGIALEEDKK